MKKKALLAVFLSAPWAAFAAPAAAPQIRFEQWTLPNGLRVIVSRDSSVPVAAVAMIFNVGGRQEARGRSGFAHLFEHMMFEGSRNAPKGSFDRVLETYGGDNNASTHEDFTLYYEVVPSNALPVALWLDADRVGALSVTQEAMTNQIEVVKEEKRMRVDNEPYGSLLYVDMASHTFVNWQNAHPVIGSFEDLDAAGLKDVQEFFDAYYAPGNAVLAIAGDVDPAQVKRWVQDYFGAIPNLGRPAAVDTTEPAPAGEKRVRLTDAHANLPALGISWKGMPERNTPDYYALALLGQILFSGKSSRLFQDLVKTSRAAVGVEGGLGFPISDAVEYKAPGAFGGFVVYKAEFSADQIKDLIYKPIKDIAAQGLSGRDLARVKTKFRSDWLLSQQTALGKAQKLLVAALLDGSPAAANTLDRFMAVTSKDLQRVAGKYLREEAATLCEVSPGGAP